MDSMEIEKILKRDRYCEKYFKGVIPSNRLKKIKLKNMCSLICWDCFFPQNINEICHFIVILNEKNQIYFYDPFGRPPYQQAMIKYLQSFKKKIKYIKLRQQHEISQSCGKFCCLFLLMYYRKKSVNEFLNLFKKNDLMANDAIVNKKLNEYIKRGG